MKKGAREVRWRSAMRLADSRALAWYAFGDPKGVPCLYLLGTPSSGRAGGISDGEAGAAGVRRISIDRPGLWRVRLHPSPCPYEITGDVH